jgi:hypothetical protein
MPEWWLHRRPGLSGGGTVTVHIYDSISRQPSACSVLIERFVRPMCSCGWVGWFESLSHDEAKRDWDKHVKVRAR